MAATQGTGGNSVAEGPPKTGDTVIIAVDGSEYSEYALKFYAEELQKPGDIVILAHSTDYKTKSYPAVSIMSGDPSLALSEDKADEVKTDALVDKLAEELETLKLTATVERLHGEAGHAIVKLAEDRHAAYIVIGSRGKGTVRRTLTGSVTDFVVHHSHLPVLVARHKDHLHRHHHHHHFHLNPFHRHKHHHGDHGDKHGKEHHGKVAGSH